MYIYCYAYNKFDWIGIKITRKVITLIKYGVILTTD